LKQFQGTKHNATSIKEITYRRVRSNKLVTAVGKGPTIDTAYTSLQTTTKPNPNYTNVTNHKSKPKHLNIKTF
jgi:hypothetical protein